MTSKEELRETIQKATGQAYLDGMDATDIKAVLEQDMQRVETLEAADGGA